MRDKNPIFWKNMNSVFREKTILLMISLLLFVLLTVSILVITAVFLYNPDIFVSRAMPVGIVGEGFLIPNIDDKFQLNFYENTEKAQEDFFNNKIDAVLEFKYDDVYVVDVILPNSPIKSSLILSILKRELQETEFRLKDLKEPKLIWPHEINFDSKTRFGMDTIFEILMSFLFPIIIIIPGFIMGNMIIDIITQEFEEKNIDLLFTSLSPMKYINEMIAFGVAINLFLVLLFAGIMYLRFEFLENFVFVILYSIVFSLLIIILSIVCSFVFKEKNVSTMFYTFVSLAVFMISPYIMFSPVYTITNIMLGNLHLLFVNFAILFVIIILSYQILKSYIKKHYYI